MMTNLSTTTKEMGSNGTDTQGADPVPLPMESGDTKAIFDEDELND